MKMASSSNSRSLKYKTDYSTRSQSVVDRMNDIYNTFNANNTLSDFTIIHELWPRFSTISPVIFNSISPPQPCILAGVNVQPRGILKQLSDKPDLVWADFENIPNYPLINITKGPEYSVTREFINSMQGDMDFANCLTSFSFLDQIVTSCIGLLDRALGFRMRILKLVEALLMHFCIRESKYGVRPPLIALLVC